MLCKKIIKVYQFKITNIVGTCITDITSYLILIDITERLLMFLKSSGIEVSFMKLRELQL